MLKFGNCICWLALLVVLVEVHADDDEIKLDDLVQAMKSIANGCDPVPEEEHIREMVLNIEDAQMGTKCFRHCLMKQFEVLEDTNKQMNQEKAVELMGMMFADRNDDLNAIVKMCNEENAAITDDCEVAHAHGMCTMRELKARDFDIPPISE